MLCTISVAPAKGDSVTSTARYDAIAAFYEQFASDTYTDQPIASLLELVGDVRHLRLLDIACGHGRLTRELARRGAKVVGVDVLRALLTLARTRETELPLYITYVYADAASPLTLHGEDFDGISCNFGLSDIDHLDGVIASVARLLRPGGFFAFSILHPCFPGWPSKQAAPSWSPDQGYYREGWWQAEGSAHGLRPKVGANHRMLSSYLNTFARHCLVLETILEPLPPNEWLANAPNVGAVPLYLVARYRRTDD
jgi:SAM-dependent methyltransferase